MYRLPPPVTKRGQLNLAGFITQISEDETRNEFIADVIREYAMQGRKMLVLSDRRAHCQAIVSSVYI